MNPNSNNSKSVIKGPCNYAQLRIAHYAALFAGDDDEKIKETVVRERKGRGWTSERSYFLAALRAECEKRHLAYCW